MEGKVIDGSNITPEAIEAARTYFRENWDAPFPKESCAAGEWWQNQICMAKCQLAVGGYFDARQLEQLVICNVHLIWNGISEFSGERLDNYIQHAFEAFHRSFHLLGAIKSSFTSAHLPRIEDAAHLRAVELAKSKIDEILHDGQESAAAAAAAAAAAPAAAPAAPKVHEVIDLTSLEEDEMEVVPPAPVAAAAAAAAAAPAPAPVPVAAAAAAAASDAIFWLKRAPKMTAQFKASAESIFKDSGSDFDMDSLMALLKAWQSESDIFLRATPARAKAMLFAAEEAFVRKLVANDAKSSLAILRQINKNRLEVPLIVALATVPSDSFSRLRGRKNWPFAQVVSTYLLDSQSVWGNISESLEAVAALDEIKDMDPAAHPAVSAVAVFLPCIKHEQAVIDFIAKYKSSPSAFHQLLCDLLA